MKPIYFSHKDVIPLIQALSVISHYDCNCEHDIRGETCVWQCQTCVAKEALQAFEAAQEKSEKEFLAETYKEKS